MQGGGKLGTSKIHTHTADEIIMREEGSAACELGKQGRNKRIISVKARRVGSP